ncbi:MAG: M48 family metallopeptidase [Gammaproteobacteria bacterium]
MNDFTILFILLLFLQGLVSFWLSRRQERHVAARREQVPQDFADRVSLDEHRKAADYTIARSRFGRIEQAAGLLLLLIWTLGGALELVDRFWNQYDWPEIATGALVIGTVLLLSALIDIPAALYRTFVIEARFGFNNSTMATFWADRIKGVLLITLLGVPLLLLILWLMQKAGGWWWLYAWAVLSLFTVAVSWAFPKFIAPLFNRFEPLGEGEVADRLQALLERTGFRSGGIFVMDGSRRSSHGNAYFTGFGRTRRIVFFDTLLKQLSPAQVEAVLAHELGHFRRRHILKGLLLSLCMSLAGFAILAWLMQQSWFFTGLGVSEPSSHMALLLFVLVSPLFTFFIGPLLAWYSRRHEFEADAFAAAHSDAESLVSALVNLYRENASSLTPDPLYSKFHDSHPPAAIRIAHLRRAASAG